MTEQALDKLARWVMLDAARLEYGGLPEEPHPFSPAFERKPYCGQPGTPDSSAEVYSGR